MKHAAAQRVCHGSDLSLTSSFRAQAAGVEESTQCDDYLSGMSRIATCALVLSSAYDLKLECRARIAGEGRVGDGQHTVCQT